MVSVDGMPARIIDQYVTHRGEIAVEFWLDSEGCSVTLVGLDELLPRVVMLD